MTQTNDTLRIGWAQTDITPRETVLIMGQFHARVSEGVENPLTATALVLEALDDQAVLVSCDLACIPDELRDGVRSRVAGRSADLDPKKLIINATHTHTAPEVRTSSDGGGVGSAGSGVELDAAPVEAYVDFAAQRIADMVIEAWEARSVGGGVALGLGHAVVGHNRRWVNDQERSRMYGLNGNAEFRHIEGYEDHSVNLLATYDADDRLIGVVVNVPCPSQVTEGNYTISADYWHETRQELHRRLGDDVFVLPQCSAAGDLVPRHLFEKPAHQRMLDLKGRTHRQEVARRLADAVEDTLEPISQAIERSLSLQHHVETLDLPMNRLTEADADTARQAAQKCRVDYEREKGKLNDQPELRDEPRWYIPVTTAFRRMKWHEDVVQRFERQQAGQNTIPAEMHALRLGEIALATCPFEYYLDFGIQIKVRSPALQTFLVQLVGNGTYLPSPRSVAGGGYGSVPASNQVGPEAGQILAEHILGLLGEFWHASDTASLQPA